MVNEHCVQPSVPVAEAASPPLAHVCQQTFSLRVVESVTVHQARRVRFSGSGGVVPAHRATCEESLYLVKRRAATRRPGLGGKVAAPADGLDYIPAPVMSVCRPGLLAGPLRT
jgi:hypothetical protein